MKEGKVKIVDKTGLSRCEFAVELAQSLEELSIGLMFRESLGPKRGMLFIFQNDEMRTFWMQNTKIPLDMIFIDSGFKVVNIHYDAHPMDTTTISSQVPARYVLEINAGKAGLCNIRVGTRLIPVNIPQ